MNPQRSVLKKGFQKGDVAFVTRQQLRHCPIMHYEKRIEATLGALPWTTMPLSKPVGKVFATKVL